MVVMCEYKTSKNTSAHGDLLDAAYEGRISLEVN